MLIFQNTTIQAEKKTILHNISLTVNEGETHVIMGPNGSGKSSLVKTIAGVGNYSVASGGINVNGNNISTMDATERALAGIFLSFQNPPAILGLTLASLIKESVNSKRVANNELPLTSAELLKQMKNWLEVLGFSQYLYKSEVNHNISGGQQKMCELLQLAMLQPSLVLLDEIDSGLDVDNLKQVAQGINLLANEKRSFVVITHYRRITDYLNNIDAVHILVDGKIAASGGRDLVHFIDKNGYDSFLPKK